MSFTVHEHPLIPIVLADSGRPATWGAIRGQAPRFSVLHNHLKFCAIVGLEFWLAASEKSGWLQRPKTGAHHGLFSGAPVQYRKEAVHGYPQGAHCGQPPAEEAVIQLGARKSASRPS